jgi:hypothetical protein
VEEAEENFERGKHWLAEGVDPRAFGPTQLWEKGRRGSVKNLNWHSHANLAILERMVIKDRILGTKEVDQKTLVKANNNTYPGRPDYVGIRRPELIAASAPSSLEVTAAILLVSMETGWIDTVWGIDLTGEWYSFRRGEDIDSLGKTDSIVLHATRPKTSKRLTAIGLAGSRFRSFQLIRGLQERTAFLRKCLCERRSQLEATEPNATVCAEIAEIDRRLRSPWLYFSSKGKREKAAGLADSKTIVHNNALKARTIEALAACRIPILV